MSDNIIKLAPRPSADFTPIDGVVARLEALLEMAKRGHVNGIVYGVSKYNPPETCAEGFTPGWVAAAGIALDGELETANRVSTAVLMSNREFVENYLSKTYSAVDLVADVEAARGAPIIEAIDEGGDDEPA